MTKEIRITLTFIVLFFIFLIFPTMVNAADTYTATSTVNGVTANWSYTLNESGQIENLKCTNPADITGNVTVPSTLNGKTVVSLGNSAFESAIGISSVTIPSSITKIEYSAFENCTNLSKVDLGNITTISFQVFKGCTSLTEITIPKTLKNGSVSPCLDNPNITKITLEEGLTIVPKNLCANTGITEITIPNSVTEIEYSAFDNCTKLKKITILDNVTGIGFYNVSDSDSIFENHDEDLTIYCYKDSMAAKYAIKYNIKYVYLTKPTTETQEDNDKQTENKNPSTGKIDSDNDSTKASGIIPYTGASMVIITVLVLVLIGGIFAYFKYNRLRDI